MDFVTPLYRTLLAQSEVEQRQATALDTRALAAQRIDNLRNEQETRQIMRSALTNPFFNATGMPVTQAPLGASPQGAAAVAEKQDDSALGLIQKQIGDLNRQANSFDQLARLISPVNPKLGESYAKEAAATRRWATTEGINALKTDIDMRKQIGGIAAGATPETFMASWRQIAALNPGALTGLSFDRPQGSAIPLPTERNIALMNQWGKQSMSAAEQGSREQAKVVHLDNELNRKAQLDQRAYDAEQSRLIREAEVAARRENAQLTRDATQANREATQAHREMQEFNAKVGIAERVASEYRKASNDFVERKPYFVTAYKYLFNDDGEKRPTSQMDSSSDMALRDAYLRIVHPNYKGSVYEKKELDKLAGLPKRFAQGFVNLFEGKELPNSVRYEMFDAMKRQFGTENQQQMELEDNYRKRLETAKVPAELQATTILPFSVRPTKAPDGAVPAPAPRAAPSAPAASAAPTAGLPRVANDAQFDALQPGTEFIDPQGNKRRKP